MAQSQSRQICQPYGFDLPGIGAAYDLGMLAGCDGDTAVTAMPHAVSIEPAECRAWMHGFEIGRVRLLDGGCRREGAAISRSG